MMTEKALTLEQLQKMRGKWVWIVSPDKDLTVSGWAYVGKDHVYTYWEYERDELVGRVVYNICDYGAWLAYKNPSVGNCAEQLMDLVQAYQDGRCVVLPFPLHRMLLNTSDPYNPELMKDFRISATWTHCGIVFHSPWDIFLQNIEKGYIRLMREEAEAMLEGGTPDAKAD